MTVCNGMICDLVTDPKLRAKAMGRNFSGVGLGFLFGSALGGVFASAEEGYFTACVLNLTLSVIGFLWVFFFLKETLKPEDKSTEHAKVEVKARVSLLGALKEILSLPDLRMLFLFHTMALICNIAPQHAYFEFIRTELLLPTSLRGLVLVSIGFATVISQSTFSALLSKIGTSNFVTLCLIGGAITTALAPMAGLILFLTTTLLSCFFGTVTSLSLSTLSNASPPHLSGTVNGLHESLSNMALMIGGLYVPFTSQIHLYAPFWISAAALILTLLVVRPTLLYNAPPASKDDKKKQD